MNHSTVEQNVRFLKIGTISLLKSKYIQDNIFDQFLDDPLYKAKEFSKKIFDIFIENFDKVAIAFYNSKPFQAGVFSFSISLIALSAILGRPEATTIQMSHFLNNGFNAIKMPSNEHVKINYDEHTLSEAEKPFFDSKVHAFTSLLSLTEGKKNTFYKDNKGIAIGYGWNPTQNSEEFNLKIAENLNLTALETSHIIKISNNQTIDAVPDYLQDFELNEEQLNEVVYSSMINYEREFLNVLKVKSTQQDKDFAEYEALYNELEPSQQAVLIHMAYKVGARNLLKYDDFFNKLFVYLTNPTELNLDNASNSFKYSYVARNGQRKRDVKVEEIHQVFFSECSIESSEKCKKIALN